MEGEVLAVRPAQGNGAVRKVDVKVGNRVLFATFAGTDIKRDGAERLIIREDDVLGVLEV